MKTIAEDMARFIVESEEEAVARFYDLIELGDDYRAAGTVKEIKRVISLFRGRGYEICRSVVSDGLDGTMRYRMLLMHEGIEIARQDIEVVIDLRWVIL
jgi:hypothetical protein